MKLITEIDNDILFMKKCYEVVDSVKKCLVDTDLLEIRKTAPKFTGNETEEERTEMIQKQAYENMMSMVKRLMFEKPESALDLFKSLIVLDEGEDYPHGIALFALATRCIMDPNIIDFFIQLMLLERRISSV